VTRRAFWLAGAGALAAAAGAAFLTTPPALPPGGARLLVRQGEDLRPIAQRLERIGVVRSGLVFRLWARATGLDRSIQPGEYRFTEPRAVGEVVKALAAGGIRHEVTIPEGLTVREVAALLAARGLGPEASFTCLAGDPEFLLEAGIPGAQLEGYLFPDTYRLSPAMSPAEILALMVRRFHERFDAGRHRRAAARGMSVDAIVTLASLVEKETGVAAERPLVAAVFHNRLRRGMRLQSDPTVIYALPAFGGALTRADLAYPSPYNTYLIPGLPPGPIANPGLAAIEAALEPADAAYLYFVSRNDGSHEFSVTLRDHNRAVDRYQRRRPPPGRAPAG
jgi:UPF0755 protein